MAEKKHKDDVSKLNFEDSIKQLKEIVERIEQGEIPLQDSLDQYEKGMTLIKHCRTILQRAEERIEKISREEVAAESGEKDAAPETNEDDAKEGLF